MILSAAEACDHGRRFSPSAGELALWLPKRAVWAQTASAKASPSLASAIVLSAHTRKLAVPQATGKAAQGKCARRRAGGTPGAMLLPLAEGFCRGPRDASVSHFNPCTGEMPRPLAGGRKPHVPPRGQLAARWRQRVREHGSPPPLSSVCTVDQNGANQLAHGSRGAGETKSRADAAAPLPESTFPAAALQHARHNKPCRSRKSWLRFARPGRSNQAS